MNLIKHQRFTALAALGWIGFAGWLVCSSTSNTLFGSSFDRSERAIFAQTTLQRDERTTQKQSAEEWQRRVDAFMADQRREADQRQHELDPDEAPNASPTDNPSP